MTSDKPQRILITRLSAVGDCVQTMPLVCALRDLFPGAHIVWVVEGAAAPLVATLREVNRVIIVPKKLLHSPGAIFQARRELLAERCDLALDPQSLMKSAFLGWLSGARRRIGFARPVGREIAPWLNPQRVQSRSIHMIDRYLELLSPLGLSRPALRFGLRVPAEIDAWAAELSARPPLAGGYVVLNPGAGWDSRLWPTERYVEVARQLGQWGVGSLVTWGGKRERAWAEKIVAGAGPAAVLAPPTSLVELTAVARRARLLVGSDTGPLHLAAAVGTPCVGLFGSTRREETGPLGSQHALLQAAYDSSENRKRPGADNWAMRQISAAIVIGACRRLLDANEKPLAPLATAATAGDRDRAA